MVRSSLLVSGLRWRALGSAAMLAVAVVAAGAGAFGPMYLHGTDQVVLNSTLDAAGQRDSGLTLVDVSGHGYPGPLLAAARQEPRPAGRERWFGAAIVTQFAAFITSTPTATSGSSTPGSVAPARTTFTFVPHAGHRLYLGSLTSRTSVCAHLKMVAGACSLKRGEVVISTRTAGALRLGVGDALDVGFTGSNRAGAMTVSGIYQPGTASAPYWWGQSFFPFGTYSIAGAYEHIDDVFASPATVRALAPPKRIYPVVQVPYDRRSLHVGDVGTFKEQLATFERSELRGGIRIGTRLFELLGRAGTAEGVVSDIVMIIDLELALLAIVVLYFVASRTASEREPDVRLAELRGFRPRSALGVALSEPVAVVVLAVPLGFLLAWLAASLAAPAVFGRHVGTGPTPAAAWAAALAGAVGVVASAAGAWRGRSVGAERPAGAARTAGGRRWSALAGAVVVATAAAAFFELVVTGESPSRGHPLAALAPGLLAVAVGVLVAWGLPAALSTTHRRSAFSPRIPLALATRVVARRREFAGQILVATLAVGLLFFAVCAWSIATTNRNVRAAFGVGAARVLHVSVRQGTTLLGAVRAADPTGRYAMAAVVARAKGGTTLALDTRRMAAVATWPAGLGISARRAARSLVPAHEAPQVVLRGTSVQLTADAHFGVKPAPSLTMDLFDLGTQTPEQVTFGALHRGTHTYRGSLSFLCTGGCRLVDLAFSWSPAVAVAGAGRPARVSFEVRTVSDQAPGRGLTPVAADLARAALWTSPSGGVRLLGHSGTLEADFRLAPNATPATIAPRDVPPALPVIVTPESSSFASGDGGPLVTGLDGASVSGHTVGDVAALPGVGTGAVLADLRTAELFLSGPFTYTASEVWLASGAPSGIIGRLRDHGVIVRKVVTAAQAQRALAHDGVSLAYLLYVVSALTAGLLVVGATVFGLVSSSRRREDELASLRAVGVDVRSLRRAVWMEQILVFGAGLVAGTAAGVVGAAVALRSVPEFVSRGSGPPLDLGLPPLVVAGTAAVLVMVVGALTAWQARATVRRATAERLGTSHG